ncbi:MAG: hypothetical protein PHN88_07675 [Ignavibacteria bacterium]|nr:hypothetical protein [Ignavibacteria bacterium]
MENIFKTDISRPINVIELVAWLEEKFDIIINEDTKFNYELNSKSLQSDIDSCQFWRSIILNLNSFNDEYKIGKNLDLLLKPNDIPSFIKKAYDSFILKILRKNVLENTNWPNEPKCGWIIPDNWFEKIRDIVRTRIVVKYLDGVDFIVKKIEEQATKENLIFKVDYEARDEGYYAAHITITMPLRIIDFKGKAKHILFNFEIQVTTQLQEVLCSLLHKYYEERRKRNDIPDIKWQWDYKSEEFAPNYLGHILHYIEGMIMDIRNKK